MANFYSEKDFILEFFKNLGKSMLNDIEYNGFIILINSLLC